MSNPRKYGKVGLFPSIPRQQPKKHKSYITDQIKKARAEYDKVGPIGHSYHCTGGACCVSCRRYIDAALRASSESPKIRPILPAECCEHCGRWPIDQALIEKGHLGVQSDPRWALERVKIADMRTTFAPGDKIIPRQREVANV